MDMGVLLFIVIILLLFGVLGGIALSPLLWLLVVVALLIFLFGRSRI